MPTDALTTVRQVAESKPDDPIYRLVLAMTEDISKFPFPELFIQESVAKCARELEATK